MRQSHLDEITRNLSNAALVLHTSGKRRLAKSILTCLFRLDHKKACHMADVLASLDRPVDSEEESTEPLPF
jgi:hypothetical protein